MTSGWYLDSFSFCLWIQRLDQNQLMFCFNGSVFQSAFNREVTLCTSQLSRRTGVTGESRARRTHSLSEWRWWLSAHSPAWRLSNKDLFLCERWTHPVISAEREDTLCDDWRSLRFAKKSNTSGRLIMQLLLQNKSLLVVLWLEAVASTRARWFKSKYNLKTNLICFGGKPERLS